MRITRVFLDVHMGQNFEGLGRIAKSAKTKLDADSVVVFINRACTAFKLMAGGQYLTYYKNGTKRIPLEALRHLPEMFGGSQMQFDSAVKKSITEKLGILNGGEQ